MTFLHKLFFFPLSSFSLSLFCWWGSLLLLLLLAPVPVPCYPWSYSCDGTNVTWTTGLCSRQRSLPGVPSTSLARCSLTCLPTKALWPLPLVFSQADTVAEFDIDTVEVILETTEELANLVEEAVDRQLEILKNKASASDYKQGLSLLRIIVMLEHEELTHDLETDESYGLHIHHDDPVLTVEITAKNYFGARHAIETVFQLADWDPVTNTFIMVDEAVVEDGPAFPHRGIMLDTARHFISVDKMKELVDSMSYSKLNVLHWHITDVQSFPLVLESQPSMALYGAYSPAQVYTPLIIKEIRDYALARGVRIIPEIDGPSHAGAGWQAFDPSFTVCLEKKPWYSYCRSPPCGQLNPISSGMYEILQDIHREVLELFDPTYLHLGGEEFHLGCWNSTESIVTWLENRGRGRQEEDFLYLWSYFQNQSYSNIVAASQQLGLDSPPKITLWSSKVTTPDFIHFLDPEIHTIQIWTDSTDLAEPAIKTIAEAGFKMIFSNSDGAYLDCGFAGWVWEGNNWCSPYKSWQQVYQVRGDMIYGSKY